MTIYALLYVQTYDGKSSEENTVINRSFRQDRWRYLVPVPWGGNTPLLPHLRYFRNTLLRRRVPITGTSASAERQVFGHNSTATFITSQRND